MWEHYIKKKDKRYYLKILFNWIIRDLKKRFFKRISIYWKRERYKREKSLRSKINNLYFSLLLLLLVLD